MAAAAVEDIGPFAVLADAVKTNDLVLVSVRNNHKLLGRVKAFDHHCNLVMTDVRELWTDMPKGGRGQKRSAPVNRERIVSKLFVRGDSVVLVVRHPLGAEGAAS